MTDAVGFAALCLTGVLAGTLFALEWALGAIPRELLTSVLPIVTRRFGPNLPPPPDGGIGQLPPLAFGSLAFSLAFAILARHSTVTLVLGLVATAGVVVGIVSTTIFLGPLNARISAWAAEDPHGAPWDDALKRWFAFNLVRAFAAGIAFAALAAALAFAR